MANSIKEEDKKPILECDVKNVESQARNVIQQASYVSIAGKVMSGDLPSSEENSNSQKVKNNGTTNSED